MPVITTYVCQNMKALEPGPQSLKCCKESEAEESEAAARYCRRRSKATENLDLLRIIIGTHKNDAYIWSWSQTAEHGIWTFTKLKKWQKE